MADRRGLRLFGPAGFQHGDRHAMLVRCLGKGFPFAQISEPFGVKADGADPAIAGERLRDFRRPGLRHVSYGHHIGDGQASCLEGHVQPDIRALRQDRDAPADRRQPMLIRP